RGRGGARGAPGAQGGGVGGGGQGPRLCRGGAVRAAGRQPAGNAARRRRIRPGAARGRGRRGGAAIRDSTAAAVELAWRARSWLTVRRPLPREPPLRAGSRCWAPVMWG